MSSRFIKNSGILLSGNALAQGLAFAAYLILLRLFTPDDLGLCNVFFSYTEVLIILSTCKYEMAVVVASDDKEASTLARLAFRLNRGVSLLLLGVVTIMTLCRVTVSKLPAILLFLIPVLVYFTGTNRVYVFLCNRNKEYKQMAAGEVVSVSSGIVTRILFGLLAPVWQFLHTVGLPVGSVLGKVAGHAYLRHITTKRRHYYDPHASITRQALRQAALKHKNFALYVMPKELVSSFSANLPLMWLSVYFDKPLLGLFSLALTFTQRPVNVLANTFEKVFYQSTSAKVQESSPIARDVHRFVLFLTAGTLIGCTLLFLFAEPLFVFLFGQQWIGVGYYVRCLMPWMGILVVTNSLAFVSNVMGTQHVDFGMQLVQLLLRATALYIGIQQNNFQLAVLLFAVVSAVVQAAQLGWYLFQVYRYDKRIASKR